MKITVSIEVANADELSQVADALSVLEVDGETNDDKKEKESIVTKKKTSKKTSKKASKKVEAESEDEMEEVPSPFSNTVQAPSEPLVQPNSVEAIPPVIEQAQGQPVHQQPAQPAQPAQPSVQQAQAVSHSTIPGFDAKAIIQDSAAKLGAFPGMSQADKQNVIASILTQIGAPQGIKGSELPEPYLSQFAQVLSQRVAQILSTNGALV